MVMTTSKITRMSGSGYGAELKTSGVDMAEVGKAVEKVIMRLD